MEWKGGGGVCWTVGAWVIHTCKDGSSAGVRREREEGEGLRGGGRGGVYGWLVWSQYRKTPAQGSAS